MADGARGLAELDFATVTPAQFAALVKGLSTRELKELAEDSALRDRVLAEVFGRMGREFKPDAAGSLSAMIRWQITGPGGAETVYETRIADRACTVHAGRSDEEPKVTLTLSEAEFLKLASGNASPVTMFMTRKVKVVGDVALAARLNRYFDIPKA
ncbi:SCP2 sterol-binding domain-containing protein [Streptomyces sp. TS71-3]|uniref:SCP2 sterol-binding domain-containing protein n=1 Tax=Streptomyces sp. TS71-3 TaxID=2733862 RepID=UPI001B037A0D|nr:SCP2 sterol-binding domain-containing protein [Streptomyces sp. TS71-3]GHJ37410.1 sterol-binding protein [Streptomyces sp. TS71-3]